MADDDVEPDATEWDYVVVGSGAGGGTLAARLAEQGMRVCVLEAGGDPRDASQPRLPEDHDVPGFHAFACENPAISWNFRVRHHADDALQARDPKFDPLLRGVLYPRAAALGGCTAHNAMIWMRPHDSDWDRIARLTADPSWSAVAMQRHAQRVEACRHRPVWRALRHLGFDPTGHGWDGWLDVERAIPLEALHDVAMRQLVGRTSRRFVAGLPNPLLSSLRWLRGKGDPNARPFGGGSFEGLCYTPLSTSAQRRVGARERLLKVAAAHPDRLRIVLDALVTRVLFDPEGAACGVEYLRGKRLYRAHAAPAAAPGGRRRAQARREVVLCGGAFNTPQLLMLSGIGPRPVLSQHGIAVRVDLPGVGRNLHDRYEIALNYRMREPWRVLAGARFERGDPLWQRWADGGGGMYASSGAALGIVLRSSRAGAEPDLFCMALPARFAGYSPGFSTRIRDQPDQLTWAVLKAHTRNRSGRVELRSADPRDPPRIEFDCFARADDPDGADLAALVEAIRFVRGLVAPLFASGVIAEETDPGPAVESDQQLAEWARSTAWGHHACGSCAIGRIVDGGVLDAALRVHGVPRLRVADAAVFPHIPGFFIASAVYMVGEKAADLLLADPLPARPAHPVQPA